MCAFVHGNKGKRNGFGPAGRAVNNNEEMSVIAGRGPTMSMWSWVEVEAGM